VLSLWRNAVEGITVSRTPPRRIVPRQASTARPPANEATVGLESNRMTELVTAPQVYARATPRLRALIRDWLVQGTIVLAIWLPASIVQSSLRIVGPVGLLAFLLYEPLFLTFQGATIGQRAMNLRVVRARDLAPVSFPRALLRTLVKSTLGIPAFLVMYFTRRHQALQDLAAGTVVVPYDPRATHAGWFDPVRGEEPGYEMPHWLHRLIVIAAYEIAFGTIMSGVVFPVMVPNCFVPDPRRRLVCGAAENVLTKILVWSFLFGVIVIFVAGALGLLWGARRRALELMEPSA
jgi:uncharacterized RDD family membrane protein YckC